MVKRLNIRRLIFFSNSLLLFVTFCSTVDFIYLQIEIQNINYIESSKTGNKIENSWLWRSKDINLCLPLHSFVQAKRD